MLFKLLLNKTLISKNLLKNSKLIFYLFVAIVIIFVVYNFWSHRYYTTEHQGMILALNIMAGSINGRFSKFLKNKLAVMSLLVNNNCNLSCKHCYLQTKKNASYLSAEEWNRALISILTEIKPTTLCFAGKEVFYNQSSADILFDAIQLRNSLQKYNCDKTEIGVITNGTLLHNFKDRLINNWPDYFDISVDGLPNIHDDIRGKGAFKSLENNLIWLKKNSPGNVWITHTIFANNIEPLPEFIKFMYSNFGINKYSIGLYKEAYYTDQELTLKESDLISLFNKVFYELASIKLNEPVEIIMEMDHTQNELLPILVSSGWIQKEVPFTSRVHTFKNGLSLKFNVAWIPVGLWRSVRITPEGYWLAAEDLMEVRNYDDYAVGNLREFNYSTDALYNAGLKSIRFSELIKGNEDLVKDCLFTSQEEQYL